MDNTQTMVTAELNQKYLTFYMDNQLMGIPLTNVEQIVRVQTITPVPEVPAYCKGVMDLRGSIIPLIDLRLRFGREEIPYDDKTAIIVCFVKEALVGYVVDSVDEVVLLQDEYISSMPKVHNSANTDYATGIARLPAGDTTKIVLLIDVEKLQDAEDIVVISNIQE